MPLEALILAAGLGTRMKSDLPKVFHALGGRPMLSWSIEACRQAVGKRPHVVLGPEARDRWRDLEESFEVIIQKERLGTGHAVAQAEAALKGKTEALLITHADLPLIRPESLQALVAAREESGSKLTLLVAESPTSRGFGRVKRDRSGRVTGIVEEAHATPEELSIRELNVGAYCIQCDWLWENLSKLPLSPKGEYYLTDLVGLAAEQGLEIVTASVKTEDEIIGINTRVHLAQAEAALRQRINQRWMLEGVTILDPANTYIGPQVEIARDTIILPNTHLTGRTVIGRGCRVGPNTSVHDSQIGDRCHLEHSVVEGAVLEEEVEVGPFAHLRQGAHLGRGVHMGNFGEVKNSTLGPGVKMGHFSYIGDAEIGEGVNIGAGTITCNYDGERKHRTVIGVDAFIGSDTMLVAPVRIGAGARTGAGSVVTKDVPDHSLAVGVPARVIRKLR